RHRAAERKGIACPAPPYNPAPTRVSALSPGPRGDAKRFGTGLEIRKGTPTSRGRPPKAGNGRSGHLWKGIGSIRALGRLGSRSAEIVQVFPGRGDDHRDLP